MIKELAAGLLRVWGRLLLSEPELPVIGEGGILDPRNRTWIRFDAIGEIRFCKSMRENWRDSVELFDTTGRRIAWLEQPDGEKDFVERIEAGIAGSRQAKDPLGFGRGASSMADWLAVLERRFLCGNDYRHSAIDAGQARAALDDVHQAADVRAGAAIALLSSSEPSARSQVQAAVKHTSPPLLVAVLDAIAPGLLDAELVKDALPYLTKEERTAILSMYDRLLPSRASIMLDVHGISRPRTSGSLRPRSGAGDVNRARRAGSDCCSQASHAR